MFRNDADLAEFRRHAAKFDAYVRESEHLMAQGRARIDEWDRQMRKTG